MQARPHLCSLVILRTSQYALTNGAKSYSGGSIRFAGQSTIIDQKVPPS